MNPPSPALPVRSPRCRAAAFFPSAFRFRRRSLFGGSSLLLILGLGLLLGTVRPAAAQVRLKEFLAVSATGIRDSDDTPQGWIELWNSSQTAKVTLTGMKLTNGTATWTFPAVEIMPDEHLIVWASGKNRTVITEPLHTNFTIPPGGGTLSLQNASGVVTSSFANYPQQSVDVSWGRDEADTVATPVLTGFYTMPTPGEPNNYTGGGVAGRVVFDQTSKAYNGTLTLNLSQAAPVEGAEIRYTISRTVPTATSTLYTGPITVTTTQMIRARVFQPGKLPGETGSEAYLLLNAAANTQNFSSAMPVMVVSNFLTTAPPDTKADQMAFLWLWEPALPGVSTVKLTDTPSFTSRVRVRRRGSSTLTVPKYNLDLEIRNAWDDAERETTLLGMPQHSDWIMHAPYSFDRSLMHNPFIFSVSNAIGRYAPRARMAEVFLEITGSSLTFSTGSVRDYYGIYNILEKIRRSGNRQNLSKLDPYNNGESGKTGGYLWKVDRADADETFSAGGVPGTGGIGMAYDYPKGLELKSPQRDPQEKYLTQFLNQFNTALQAGNKDPQTGWPAYLDILPTIDHHLMDTWALCTDALRLSGYWHKDRDGKMAAGPLWDFDRAFASADERSVAWMNRVVANPNNGVWRSIGSDLGTDFFNKSTDAVGVQTPVWWHALFRDPDFYQQYIDRWEELRAGPFTQASMEALIDAWNAEINPAAALRDSARWTENPKRPYTSTITKLAYTGQAAEVQRLKDFMRLRGNFMDSQWVGRVSPSVPAGTVTPGTAVTLSGPAGAVIHYTLDGTDPRPAGGGPPGAQVLTYTAGTPIVIQATTRLRARARNAAHTALTGLNRPSANLNNPPLLSTWGGAVDFRYSVELPPQPGSLVITEFNFHATDPTPAEAALNPAWSDNDFEFVELRNIGSAPMDLTGVQFTAGITYVISAASAVTLAPGQYLVIASNPAAFAARYGAAIPVLGPWEGNLSNSGETLTVADTGGAPLVSLTYEDDWSPAADGGGSTLTVMDPASPNYNSGANWTTSSRLAGTPGSADRLAVFAGRDTGGPLSGISLTGLPDVPTGSPPVTFTWSKTAGPGDVTFTPADAPATSAVFSQAGVYTLKLTASDGVSPVSDEITAYVTDSPASWLAAHPGIGTLTDDFDKDGRSNLLEYVMATDPSLPDHGAPVATALENGVLTLTWTRLRPQAAVSYTVEVSSDLITFRAANPGEFKETILNDEGLTQTVKVTDTTTAPGAQGKRFVRLKITALP
ncbi:MAG: CotH kinase family protein [Verrucomicrobiota bacterium]